MINYNNKTYTGSSYGAMNNNVFKVKLSSLETGLEQQSSPKENTFTEIKLGDWISGEELSQLKNTGKKVSGKVITVIHNGEKIESYKIVDNHGTEYLVDPTTVHIEDSNESNVNHFLTYKEWLAENKF